MLFPVVKPDLHIKTSHPEKTDGSRRINPLSGLAYRLVGRYVINPLKIRKKNPKSQLFT